MPKLATASLNAVLSSGDGGAGRKLWDYLPYFSEITYSLPLSVAIVNKAAYDGLERAISAQAVDAASRKTETELWLVLSTRLQENYARMRQNGVTIDSNPAPDHRSAAIGGRDGAAGLVQQVGRRLRSNPRCLQSRQTLTVRRSMTAMLATQCDETPADQFSSFRKRVFLI